MFSKWQIACDERFGINNDAASPLPPFLSSSSPRLPACAPWMRRQQHFRSGRQWRAHWRHSRTLL